MNWFEKTFKINSEKMFINEKTYQDIYDEVNILIRKIYCYVNTEKRVAIYASNSEKTIIFILALLVLKKEVLLLNSYLTKEEINKQIADLGINIIFSSEEVFTSFEEVEQKSQIDVKFSWEVNYEDIAVIMNTSATTGSFKSVPIKWKQIDAHVKSSAKALGVHKDDNWLIVLPLFHISGLSILFRSLYNGTQVCLLNKFEEDKVLNLISSNQINIISIVPSMLKRIYKKITKHSLRVILLGGEFVPYKLVYDCLQMRLPIYKTYGMTETTSQSTTFSVLDFPSKIISVGKPLQGVKIAIKEPDKYGIGEICISSPMTFDGYIGLENIKGYFNTGDIGYIEKDGFLYLLNRRKDIIISGGENIYPKEIEDLLYELSEVKECAVIGIEDEKWGQSPILYIVSSIEEDVLKEYLTKNLAKYKIPKKIIYKNELPKNSLGKILRNRL